VDKMAVLGTDLRISRVVLGTMTFGSQVDETEARQMVDRSLAAGINMFDTANAYNAGESERMLGAALEGRRSDVLIATKVFNPMGEGPEDKGLSEAAIHKAINASLERLRTDYVDVYYFHQPDRATPIEESLAAMGALVEAGKVRHLGVSNYAAWQVSEINCLRAEQGRPPVLVSQQMYNLLARRIEEEYASYSEDANLFDIVYNPLAGGLLTGKHAAGSTPQQGTRFTQEMYRRRYWDEAHFDAVERLRSVASDAGLSLVELSFRWLLSRPLVDAVLVGASSIDHLESNLAACDGSSLDQEVFRRCDEVWADLRGPAAAYNR
jgi:aryl-alcohol dehydrogenase-like predicted oxidoreductase